MQWVENDWEFMAEGGAHVICRYKGYDAQLSGLLLRIKKGINIDGAISIQQDFYEETVILPLLSSPGLLHMHPILIPKNFIIALEISIFQYRPISRKRKPIISNTIANSNNVNHVLGHLLVDASKVYKPTLPLTLTMNNSNNVDNVNINDNYNTLNNNF